MNHIFKVVWSAANNTWVVTSELGKSLGKKTTRAKKLTAFATGLGLLFNIGFAASCGFNGGILDTGGKTCTEIGRGSYSDYAKYEIRNSILETRLSNGQQNAFFEFRNNRDQDGSVKVTLKDSEIFTSGGDDSAILVKSERGGHVELELFGDNKVTVDGEGDTGLILENYTDAIHVGWGIDEHGQNIPIYKQSGDASLTIDENSNLKLVNNADWGNASKFDGLEVNTYAGKSAVSFLGAGSVFVKGGHAIKATTKYFGDITVDVSKNVLLQTDTTNPEGTDSFVGDGIHAFTGDDQYGRHPGNIDYNIKINSGATINILGKYGVGIRAISNSLGDGSSINIHHEKEGHIFVSNKENILGHGIYSEIKEDGIITFINEGKITTVGSSADGIHVIGNGETKITNEGVITSNHQGIYVKQSDKDALTMLTNDQLIDTSNGLGGINFAAAGKGVIDLNQHSAIKGGKGFGVKLVDGENTLTNLGEIGSVNDLAILSTSEHKSKIINTTKSRGSEDDGYNLGVITGYIKASAEMDFENNGTFNLRHVENGVQNLAVSDFAGGTITNTGTIQFGDVSHATEPANTTGNLSTGYGQEVSLENGLMQGHFTGVESFIHSGIIDLRGKGDQAGNILKISGENGAFGTFTANGGELYLKTQMNAGGKDSLSDVLVLDNVKLGSKATGIYLTYAGGSKEDIKTTENGILLVQALGDKIDTGAFELANGGFSYGIYEYSLVGINDQTGKNGFYLQNGTESGGIPPIEWTPIDPETNVKPPVEWTPIDPETNVKPPQGDDEELTPINPPQDGEEEGTPVDPPQSDDDEELKPIVPHEDDEEELKPIDPPQGDDEGQCAATFSTASEECSVGDAPLTEIDPETNVKPPNNKPQGVQYSPNVGAYLGMQYAAAHMFDQNILDRRDNVRKPDETVWGRVEYSETKGDHFNDSQSLKVKTTLIQLGWDLFQNEERTSVFGIFAGYGNSDIKNRSILTGTEAEGNVKGYQIGAYYSWMKQEEVGTYVDVWGHFAKYRNKFEGKTQNYQTTGYNGHGFSISAEIGHGFVVDTSDNGNTQWVLEPHAQVTYNYLKNKGVTDATGTEFTGNKAKGFDTRLGARF